MGYGGNEPNGAPTLLMNNVERRDHESWGSGQFDSTSSVNAVSFGFVATAILISLFLIMAIFEKFLTPSLPHINHSHIDFNPKLGYPSPKVVYAEDISVLMPGEDIPTFIAQPVPLPLPCPPDRIQWPPPPTKHT